MLKKQLKARSLLCSVSGFGSEVGLVRLCDMSTTSATGLRHYRMSAPASLAASLVPPPPPLYPLSPVCAMSSDRRTAKQRPRKPASVLPPATEKLHATQHQNELYSTGMQSSSVASVGSIQQPAMQIREAVKSESVSALPNAPVSSMVSPSKFFMHGGLDFDSYIGRPIGGQQSQTVVKSEYSTLAAAMKVAMPSKKRPPASGVKRKLEWTSPEMEGNSKSKTNNRFADKFQESLMTQGCVDTAEGDKGQNKWTSIMVVEKESRVCIVTSVICSFLYMSEHH